MYVRYAVIVISLAWGLASTVLIQIVDFEEHLFLISAIQTFIWGVCVVGLLLPLICYPNIAYKIYISNENTKTSMNEAKTTQKETERKQKSKNKVFSMEIQSSASNRPNNNKRFVFLFTYFYLFLFKISPYFALRSK